MKRSIPFFILAIVFTSLSSCKKCGTCYITVDGVEEPDTRKTEMCDDAYETLQESGQEIDAWELVYPDSDIEYVCEDS